MRRLAFSLWPLALALCAAQAATLPSTSYTRGVLRATDPTNFVARAFTVGAGWTDGDVLTWSAANKVWTNAQPPGAGAVSDATLVTASNAVIAFVVANTNLLNLTATNLSATFLDAQNVGIWTNIWITNGSLYLNGINMAVVLLKTNSAAVIWVPGEAHETQCTITNTLAEVATTIVITNLVDGAKGVIRAKATNAAVTVAIHCPNTATMQWVSTNATSAGTNWYLPANMVGRLGYSVTVDPYTPVTNLDLGAVASPQ